MSRMMILPAIGVWPMLEYELDIIQRRLDAGDDGVWLKCDGNAPFCPANLELKKRICAECKSRTGAGLAWLKSRERLIIGSLYDLKPSQLNATRVWAEKVRIDSPSSTTGIPQDLAELDWYESSFSTLQTTFKEFRPDLGEHAAMLRRLVLDFFQSYIAFRNNIDRFRPDEVWLFNGRITRFRPALRIAQRESTKVFVYEYPYQGFKRYLVVGGQYPHDFTFRSNEWKKRFNTNPLPLKKKLAIGDAWYRKRLARVQTSYEKVFSSWQTKGLLPPNWNPSCCNVAVFNSSEWESAGVPESRRWNYKDQYSAIERIAQDTSHIPNLHFTFRIHPHMVKWDKESAERFMTLNKFKNVTVLPAESNYDTYALVMSCDVVLTFYSLTGIESAWLGKRVICLGPSPYESFGGVYLPRTHGDLIDTLTCRESWKGRFPSPEMRKRAAQEFAFARLFSGTKPKYILKKHYTKSFMWRDGVVTSIRANKLIIILNRLLSLPSNFMIGLRQVLNDEFLRNEIKQRPVDALRRFLQDRLGGLTP